MRISENRLRVCKMSSTGSRYGFIVSVVEIQIILIDTMIIMMMDHSNEFDYDNGTDIILIIIIIIRN
jgi:hypothetical protein